MNQNLFKTTKKFLEASEPPGPGSSIKVQVKHSEIISPCIEFIELKKLTKWKTTVIFGHFEYGRKLRLMLKRTTIKNK